MIFGLQNNNHFCGIMGPIIPALSGIERTRHTCRTSFVSKMHQTTMHVTRGKTGDPDDRISVLRNTVRAHAHFSISGQEYRRLFAMRAIFLGAVSVQRQGMFL